MNHNPALDGIRALSILAVVAFHCEVPVAGGGFIGLDLFFVLSGYLITTLLLAEQRAGGIQPLRFYGRRALRLLPTLLVMVVTYLLVAPFAWPEENRWLSAALTAFFAWDYALAFGEWPITVAHTWSLGVEAKFYLLWPFLLPALMRLRQPALVLFVAFCAVTAWRYVVAQAWPWQQAYFSFDTRMSGILLGALAALTRFAPSRATLGVAAVALAVGVLVPSLPRIDQVRAVTLGITGAELCAFVLVADAAIRGPGARLLASRPMAYLGRLSYGIFVWHFPLVQWCKPIQAPWSVFAITLVFSTAMAMLCLHGIDEPLRRWRLRRRVSSHAGLPL